VRSTRDGHKIVDLWGGYRDGVRRLPWREDTVVVMYSTTKGVSSLALALAHSRGLLDYDARVAAYWPQFAWRGKEEITVRQLLSHQAGLTVAVAPSGPPRGKVDKSEKAQRSGVITATPTRAQRR